MALSLEQMKANRKLWVEALRSGKYKQTKEVMKTSDGGMCCLGVLADIAGCGWSQVAKKEDGTVIFTADENDDYDAPPSAMGFVGLRTSEGRFGRATLAGKNDAGHSFNEIADIIESEPEGLFIESAQP